MAKTQKEIIEALQVTGGIVSEAAGKLGITPDALRKRVRDSDVIKEAIEEIREQTKDLAEGNVITALRAGDKDMSKWYLASLARDRGFGNKAEIEVKGTLSVERRDLSKLSDEELRVLEETVKKIEPANAG